MQSTLTLFLPPWEAEDNTTLQEGTLQSQLRDSSIRSRVKRTKIPLEMLIVLSKNIILGENNRPVVLL